MDPSSDYSRNFGELRALLHEPPSAHAWQQMMSLVEQWPVALQRRELLPYLGHHLEAWPEHLRLAEHRWFRRDADGEADPRLGLARTLRIDIVYWGAGGSGRSANLASLQRQLASDEESRIDSRQLANEDLAELCADGAALPEPFEHLQLQWRLTLPRSSILHSKLFGDALRRADGVIFVVDSSAEQMVANDIRLTDLHEELDYFFSASARDLAVLLQYNRRDCPDALSLDALSRRFNPGGHFSEVEARAALPDAPGVLESLQVITEDIVERLLAGDPYPRSIA
jgi:hypothetical protein